MHRPSVQPSEEAVSMQSYIQPLVVLLDPSCGGANLGDSIIADAVVREIRTAAPHAFLIRLSLHQGLTAVQHRYLRDADLIVVAGSNVLTPRFTPLRSLNRWKLSYLDILRMPALMLAGVGWSRIGADVTVLGRLILRHLLSQHLLHSVRDDLTRLQLLDVGISNVENTSCPSMWQLTPDHLARVPMRKAPSVLTTLTDYDRSPLADRVMLESLREHYERVILWPQGRGDVRYLRRLVAGGIEVLPPTREALENALTKLGPIDYVGTRLHCGIRSLQLCRRTLILAVDHRALEIAKDTCLPALARNVVHRLPELIHKDLPCDIRLPQARIDRWRREVRVYLGE